MVMMVRRNPIHTISRYACARHHTSWWRVGIRHSGVDSVVCMAGGEAVGIARDAMCIIGLCSTSSVCRYQTQCAGSGLEHRWVSGHRGRGPIKCVVVNRSGTSNASAAVASAPGETAVGADADGACGPRGKVGTRGGGGKDDEDGFGGMMGVHGGGGELGSLSASPPSQDDGAPWPSDTDGGKRGVCAALVVVGLEGTAGARGRWGFGCSVGGESAGPPSPCVVGDGRGTASWNELEGRAGAPTTRGGITPSASSCIASGGGTALEHGVDETAGGSTTMFRATWSIVSLVGGGSALSS